MSNLPLLHCLRKLSAITLCILKRSVDFCFGLVFLICGQNSAANA